MLFLYIIFFVSDCKKILNLNNYKKRWIYSILYIFVGMGWLFWGRLVIGKILFFMDSICDMVDILVIDGLFFIWLNGMLFIWIWFELFWLLWFLFDIWL